MRRLLLGHSLISLNPDTVLQSDGAGGSSGCGEDPRGNVGVEPAAKSTTNVAIGEQLGVECARRRWRIGRAGPSLLPAELDRLRRRREPVLELVRELEAEREAALSAATANRSSRQIAALQQIRGIGANFAAVVVHEVFYRGFENRRQIASYVGIVPTPHKSGTMDGDRGISRAGNPRVRTTLIQLAWLWLRYQPDSELAAWFRARVGALQGRTRRIAIVAIARKLLIALWRYVETGLIPAGITLRAERQAAV